MDKKREILKKYKMFLKIKKSLIVLGILSVINLSVYAILDRLNKNFSVIFMVLTIIFVSLFFILTISINLIKKHILSVIKEYENIWLMLIEQKR